MTFLTGEAGARARARRRPGYAGFIVASVALHAALVAIPFRTHAPRAPAGTRPPADASALTPRLRTALRGAFEVVNLRVAEAAPAEPRSEGTLGSSGAARTAAIGSSDAWAALSHAVLASAAGSSLPRSLARGSDPRGRLKPPVPLRVVWPEYPAGARRSRSGGTVVLVVHVTPEGRVDAVRIDRNLPDPVLNAAAVEAARRLLFEPARLDGKAVDVWFRYPITFAP